MNSRLISSVGARWARLGAMLNVSAADQTPDIELLLLDTARVSSANTRLFVLAATWLTHYGDYVAKHRLARLIRDELELEYRPILGLLLDWAREHSDSNSSRFNLAIDACACTTDARPLSDIENRNVAFARLAEKRASALSRKWRRWISEFESKDDALRPVDWVAKNNPSLATRALTGGDLAASILAEYSNDSSVIESESELARRCGASRPAIRDAVRRLQLAGYVRLVQIGRNNSIALTSA